MVVAFEGETKCGSRHAHILAYVPPPTKNALFPFDDDQPLPMEVSVLLEQVHARL